MADADLITADEAKAQLNMEVGEASPDDALIALLIQGSTALIVRRLGRKLVDAVNGPWKTEADIPADLKIAALLIVSELHANREASIVDMPFVENLICDYASVSFG